MRLITDCPKFWSKNIFILISLILFATAFGHADDSHNQEKPKYATLEDLRDTGHAKNTLCITLLSADARPLQNVLILLSCENMIGGTGGETNDEGTLCLSQLPNRKCRAHTRMIGAMQAEKEIMSNKPVELTACSMAGFRKNPFRLEDHQDRSSLQTLAHQKP